MVNDLLKKLYNRESVSLLDVQNKLFIKMIANSRATTFKHYVSDNRSNWRCVGSELPLKEVENVLNEIKQMKVLTLINN